jgi:hypothetical protein
MEKSLSLTPSAVESDRGALKQILNPCREASPYCAASISVCTVAGKSFGKVGLAFG